MAEEAISPTSQGTAFSRSSTAASHGWSSAIPFEADNQLNTDLTYTESKTTGSRHLFSTHPSQTLPDAPRIPLETSSILSYTLSDLDTPNLNKMGKKLLWVAPSIDIKPLSAQLTIRRTPQITEDPSLHCIWADDTIFLKPLPAYLCSHAFWQHLLDPQNTSIDPDDRDRLVATSLGFLRSYAHLIQHRSDFNLARKHDLLSSFPSLTFETFTAFIHPFETLPDKATSMRYRFGLLPLDSLNLHSTLHLRRWHLNRFESCPQAYFQRFFPAILFIFALCSVILSAMQVVLGAEGLRDMEGEGTRRMRGVFTWASYEAIGWCVGFGVMFLGWWVGILVGEGVGRWRGERGWKRRQRGEEGGA